jgi:DNA mismatch repair protein MutS2
MVANSDDREVVPHSLALGDDNRILLISGPNAGGKSVAMKSVGLNQLMLQSGLLPCAEPDSVFRIFDKVFVDIGDEQSIDNDLSTYSSHLRNMVMMIRNAGSNSLVLIDEFGSGTDPVFGGSIAEAVLSQLVELGVFGIITTHFSNLKLYADNTAGLLNAAMLFDLKNLKPLYALEVGRPGSSFSLEVAAKSGLPKSVIKKAEAGVGTNQIEIENLLTRLEDEKRRYELQNKKLAEKDHQLNQLKNEYKVLKKKLEDKQKDIINLAKQEASQILSRTNKEIEKTIRHIKENKAEKKETKRVRESLQKFAGKVRPESIKTKPDNIEIIEGQLQKGDQALLKDKNVIVTIEEIKGKKAKVLMGELQSVVALKALQKISNREAKKRQTAANKASSNSTVNQLLAVYTPTLDVRGTRATDLLGILQKFIDESVMLGQQSVKVIHGKGNGVLRDLVRNELRQWPQVERYENEHVERGGDGATVIYFK